MGKGSASKGRTWMIITIVLVSLIVALGVGLGVGLTRDKGSESSQEATTAAPSAGATSAAPSPLFVAPSTSKEGRYKFAAVASDAEECAQIGTRIMAVDGGSAVDAAIAAILCVGVHNAHSCGIGGGFFMTYYKRSTEKVYSIIAREQAPSGASENMYVNVSSQKGGPSIGIPGEVRGLYEAHKLGGVLPWKHLFQPSIKLCRDGFTVQPALIQGLTSKETFYDEFPRFKELITNPETGELYKAGETMRRPLLANTLSIIAEEGPNAFYNGSLAANITQDIADAGGIITAEDLANYTALVTDAIKFRFLDNRTAWSPPPPSSGSVYQLILNILDGYKLSPSSVATVENATLTWHRITEAFKHAYSLRTHLGDYNVGTEAFKAYVQQLVTNMTSSEYGDSLRSKIHDHHTHGWKFYNPSFTNEWDHGTAHLSVLGPNGDAVSITSTINLHFGSKVIGKRTGIVFNDEMDDFSTPGTINFFGVPASPANYIEPWKRPLSSMCPSIVVGSDGEVELVVGASGGTRITTSSALITMETLWFNWDVKEAIDYPRIHHQLFPESIQIQKGFPQVVIDNLRDMGHNITMRDSAGCVVQGIRVEGPEVIMANSDYRKGGAPDGY